MIWKYGLGIEIQQDCGTALFLQLIYGDDLKFGIIRNL